MGQGIKKRIFLLAVLIFFILLFPSLVAAQETGGKCDCKFSISGDLVTDSSSCKSTGNRLGADCSWQTGSCTCEETLTALSQSECKTDAQETLDLAKKTQLTPGISIFGGCAWIPARAEEGEAPTEPGGAPTEIKLQPPFGQEGAPEKFIQATIGKVIQWALGIVGSIALLMFVVGGFIWLTAAGNPDRIQRGKSILVWAAIGLVVIFAAYAITRFIFTALLG